MSPVEIRPLRPLQGFAPLFGWGLRRTLRAKKFLIGGLLGTAAIYGIGALTRRSDDRALALYEMLDNMVLAVVVPLCALGLVGGGFGEEVAEQTLAFHLVRPVRRSTIYVARFLAGLVPGIAVAAAMVAAACFANGSPIGGSTVVSLAAAAAIGVTTLGAVYYALAALFRRGLVAGLVYTFLLEGLFQFLPGSMQKLSITFHVRSLAHRWSDDAFAPLSDRVRHEIEKAMRAGAGQAPGDMFRKAAAEPWSDTSTVFVLCLAIVLGSLVIGGRAVERRDYALKD